MFLCWKSIQQGTKDPKIHLPIIMKPIDFLKGSLKQLWDQTQAWKVALEARLKAGQPISEADEEWLDGARNLVDEECLLDKLDKASDYNHAIKKLDVQEQFIVQKLIGLVENDDKMAAPSKKCKYIVLILILIFQDLKWLSCYRPCHHIKWREKTNMTN